MLLNRTHFIYTFLIRIGIAIVLFSSVVFVPWVLFPFIVGKVLVLHIGIACILVGFGWRFAVSHSFQRPAVAVILFAIFVAWSTLTTFTSIDQSKSFWGTPERGGGLIFWIEMLIFLYAFSSQLVSESIRQRYFWYIAFLGVVATIPALIDVLLHGQHRVESMFGNPILFGNFLLFPFFVSCACIFKSPRKTVKYGAYAMAAFCGIGIYLTQTRGVLIGLLVGLFCSSFIELLSSKNKVFRRFFIGSVLCMVVLVTGIYMFRNFHRVQVAVPSLIRLVNITLTETSASQRFSIWRIALQGVSARPIFGWGPETFDYVFDRYFDPSLTKYGFSQTWADRSHNMWLDLMVMEGIPGFLLFSSLLVFVFYRALVFGADVTLRRQNTLLAGALCAYAVQGMTAFDGPATTIMLFAVIGLISECDVATVKLPRSTGIFLAIIVWCVSILLVTLIIFSALSARAMMLFETRGTTLSDAENMTLINESVGVWSPYRFSLRQRLANIVFERSSTLETSSAAFYISKAIDELKLGIIEHPKNFSYQFSLGNLLTKSAFRFDLLFASQADAVFQAATPLSPNRQAIYLQRANLKLLEKKYDEAVKLLEYAVSLAPDVAQVSFQWGLALTYTPDRNRGLDVMVASTVKPHYAYFTNDPAELNHIARVALEEKRYDVAALVFSHMVALDFEILDNWHNLYEALKLSRYHKKYILEYLNGNLDRRVLSPEATKIAAEVVSFIENDAR